jgi:hypothetical protein
MPSLARPWRPRPSKACSCFALTVSRVGRCRLAWYSVLSKMRRDQRDQFLEGGIE